MKMSFSNSPSSMKAYLVLGFAIFLSVAAAVELVWHEITRSRTPLAGGEVVVSGNATTPALPSPEAFLQPAKPPQFVSNLFHSVYIERTLQKQAEEKSNRDAARKAALDSKAQESAMASAASLSSKACEGGDKVSKLPPPVRFCFQGVIRSADGRPWALLAVSPAGKSLAVSPGEACHGAVVTNVTTDSVALILNDGSVRTVSKGVTESIPEALLHEP